MAPIFGGAVALGLWVVGGLGASLVIWLATGEIAIWLYVVTLPLGIILGAVGGRLIVEMELLAQRAGGWAAKLLQLGEPIAFFGPLLAGIVLAAWLYLVFLAA